MDLSIIIVNYKTPKLVEQCVLSIIEHTHGVDYEIIVVDNNSQDNSETYIKQKCPETIFKSLENNYGFGYANNRGSEIAKGDFLFFLNSDTVITDNSISQLYLYTKENSESVGVCGGNLVDGDLNPTSSFTRIFPGISSELCLMTGNLAQKIIFRGNDKYNYTNKPLSVARVSGADMMISKSLYERIGGFDEDYFLYSEETDLQYRVKSIGYDIICIPQSKIIHLEGQSCSFEKKKVRWGLISRDRFLNKRYSIFGVVFCNILHWIATLLFILRGYITNDQNEVSSWLFVNKNVFKIKKNDSYN